MKDTERQTYSEIGVYPHDVVCPENILNIWDGYAVEKYPESNADISPILNHLRIITKEEKVYEFILDWLANMFQYPSNKSVMIVIQGQEGSGKSVLCDFITKMLGESAIEVNDVKETLFGKFNGRLSRKVFVNINETERRDMNQFFERMKALITSPTIDIEEKGQKKYVEQSLLHFLSTLNNDNVFKITKDSRRYCYIETSNELCGNTEYFADLFAFIDKKSNQRAFYDFLMTREVKKRITEKDIPETQAMLEQYELNRDPIEDYAIEFNDKRNASENYNAFKMFMKEQGLEYVMSKKLFELRFNKVMNNYGIEKKRLQIDGVKATYYYKPSLEQADELT
jgi:putative DNA primase/helicase